MINSFLVSRGVRKGCPPSPMPRNSGTKIRQNPKIAGCEAKLGPSSDAVFHMSRIECR